MAEFKKGAVLRLSSHLIVFVGICLFLAGWAEATIIKGIRTGSEQAYVRMVIETNTRLEPRPKITVNRNTLQIFLAGVEKDSSILKSEAYHDDVVSIDVNGDFTETRINAILAFNPIRIRTFFLKAPHRFVVDAYRPSSVDTDDPSAEAQTPVSIIEENGGPPNEATAQERSSQKNELSVSKQKPASPPFASSSANGSNKDDFQRHLLLFLIVVTTIILVVILFLMCLDKRQNKNR